MNYDVDYFIKKFKAIPEKIFIAGWHNKDGKKCARGHCGADSFTETEESKALRNLFKLLGISVISVNDNDYKYEDPKFAIIYNQESPKKRILAALHDIKKKIVNQQ